MLLAASSGSTVPVVAFADDGKEEPPAKPAAPKVEAPAPLTERERWLLDRVEQLEKRVAELEVKANVPAIPATLTSATQPVSSAAINPSSSATVALAAPGTNVIAAEKVVAAAAMQEKTPTAKPQKTEPFAFADFTWLTGNARTKESPMDTKFFTPEIRADVDYVYDFAHPKDDTIGGSSEVFRASHAARSWRGLSLRQCARAFDDTVWFVFSNDAAQRRQPFAWPMEFGQCLPLHLGSVRWLPLQCPAWNQCGRRNLYVLCGPLQLLPV
jgi:hypothetical protein